MILLNLNKWLNLLVVDALLLTFVARAKVHLSLLIKRVNYIDGVLTKLIRLITLLEIDLIPSLILALVNFFTNAVHLLL